MRINRIVFLKSWSRMLGPALRWLVTRMMNFNTIWLISLKPFSYCIAVRAWHVLVLPLDSLLTETELCRAETFPHFFTKQIKYAEDVKQATAHFCPTAHPWLKILQHWCLVTTTWTQRLHYLQTKHDLKKKKILKFVMKYSGKRQSNTSRLLTMWKCWTKAGQPALETPAWMC